MRLLIIISLTIAPILASAPSVKRRRDLEWDVALDLVHHEYHGPPAPLSEDGQVIDTPEVMKARENHLAIHAETVAEHTNQTMRNSSMGNMTMTEAPQSAEPGENGQAIPDLYAWLLGGQEPPRGEEAPAAENSSGAEGQTGGTSEGETRPVTEGDFNNDIFGGHYKGPLAPLGEDGRVLDTPEVQKAKEAHLMAYEQAVKLATMQEEMKEEEAPRQEQPTSEAPALFDISQGIYPTSVQLFYPEEGFHDVIAPIDENGRVIDTTEVERARSAHQRAYEQAARNLAIV